MENSSLLHAGKIILTALLIFFSVNLYAEDSIRRWKNISPEGGRPLQSFASSPSDEKFIYAFSGNHLFKSQDLGLTWSRVAAQNASEFTTEPFSVWYSASEKRIPNLRGVRSVLRVSATNPQTLFAIKNGALSKSVDGGIQWHKVSKDVEIDTGTFFLLNPQPMSQILKGLVFSNKNNADDGLYLAISTDDGEHWTVSETSIQKIKGQATSIEGADPNNPHILYGRSTKDGVSSLYKSTDGGLNWFTISPLVSHQYEGDLRIHPLDSNILYARFSYYSGTVPLGIGGSQSGTKDGFMHSEDGGVTWNPIASASEKKNVGNLTLDPTNSHTIYADLVSFTGPTFGISGAEPLIAKSIDSGKNWQLFKTGIKTKAYEPYEQGVVVNPLNNQVLLYSSTVGAILTYDGGLNWFESHSDLRSRLGQLTIAEDNPNIMYFSSLNSYQPVIFKSIDGGEHWNKSRLSLPSSENRHCIEFVINPKNNQDILCIVPGSTEGKLYRSLGVDINWELIFTPNDSGFHGHITYANDGRTIY